MLEYVQGCSLGDYVKEEKLGLDKLVRLAERIASGLAAAHKLNIVHRDIKPDNIIIDDSGDPKILDFGRANEGLGLTAEAIENYSEFLKFWENADIQIKPITDAKKRLARLTS